MEDELEAIKYQLFGENYDAKYPEERQDIRKRYKDTALQIYKENCANYKSSMLSFGGERTSLISSYGNTPTFMRRSMSSGGILGYSYEQYSSLKRSGSRLFPLIRSHKGSTNDVCQQIDEDPSPEDDVKPCHQQEISKLAEPQVTKSEDFLPTYSKAVLSKNTRMPVTNHKSFHQYDIVSKTVKDKTEEKDTNVIGGNSIVESYCLPNLTGTKNLKKESIPNQTSDMTQLINSLEKTINSISEGDEDSNEFSEQRLPQISCQNREKGLLSSVSPSGIECDNESYNTRQSINYLYQRTHTTSTTSNSKSHQSKSTATPEPKTSLPYSVADHLPGLMASKPPTPPSKTQQKPPKTEVVLTSFTLSKEEDGNSAHMIGYRSIGSKKSSYMWSSSSSSRSLPEPLTTISPKILEKTVGENLITTQALIKSFPYIDSDVNSCAATTNSSRLCAIM